MVIEDAFHAEAPVALSVPESGIVPQRGGRVLNSTPKDAYYFCQWASKSEGVCACVGGRGPRLKKYFQNQVILISSAYLG